MAAQIGLTIGIRNMYNSACSTERWYHRTASSPEAAKADAKVLIEKRAQMLGVGARILSGNLSDDQEFRDVLVAEIPPEPPEFQAYNPAFIVEIEGKAITDFAYSVILARVTGPSTKQNSNRYISWCPDDAQHIQNHQSNSTAFNTAFDNFAAELVAKWSTKGLDVGVTLRRQVTAVQGMGAVAGTGPFQLTTSVPHNMQTGDMIRLRGIYGTGTAQLNKLWQVERVGDTIIRLVGSTGSFAYTHGGITTPRIYVLQAITKMIQLKFTSRQRGSSLSKLVGRRKGKKCTACPTPAV